jgi:hypothetical protein
MKDHVKTTVCHKNALCCFSGKNNIHHHEREEKRVAMTKQPNNVVCTACLVKISHGTLASVACEAVGRNLMFDQTH